MDLATERDYENNDKDFGCADCKTYEDLRRKPTLESATVLPKWDYLFV